MHDSANTIRFTQFQGTQLKASEGKIVERCSEILLVGVKAQSHEGGGRILLSDNRSGGAVALRHFRLRCVGVWISNGPPCLYIHS
jgi:hypothetical protein